MPDADNGSLIITVLSFNGTNFGIAQNFSGDFPVGIKPLSNQGKLGASAIGIVSKGGIAVITWVAGPGAKLFTPGTKGDIVYTSKDAVGGGTQSRPMEDMVALDGKIMHSDRDYAILSQTFMNESDDAEFAGHQQ